MAQFPLQLVLSIAPNDARLKRTDLEVHFAQECARLPSSLPVAVKSEPLSALVNKLLEQLLTWCFPSHTHDQPHADTLIVHATLKVESYVMDAIARELT